MENQNNENREAIYPICNKKTTRRMSSELEATKDSHEQHLPHTYSDLQNTLKRQSLNNTESEIVNERLQSTALYNQQVENDDQASIVETFVGPNNVFNPTSKVMGSTDSNLCCTMKPVCDIF
jgi:hypothetical protein